MSSGSSTRFLRAEELARLAGLAKSTVLAAIRRGEIRSSRTLGRGTRIPIDSAREYLARRGKEIPDDLREARTTSLALLSEHPALVERVQSLADEGWTVRADREVYSTLLWVGLHAPSCVIVDLDMALLNPFRVLHAIARRDGGGPRHLVALASHPTLLAPAREFGATLALPADEIDGLGALLVRGAA